jgi:acyl-CoA synthetase (AMP-forming)/AMP-acid ligase II
LERFAERLGPFGFQRTAFCPGYGLAEATLIVTGVPTAASVTEVIVKADSLRAGHIVQNTNVDDKDASCFLSSGVPFDGLEVWIADEHGNKHDDDVVGEIVVQGETVAAGYHDDNDSSATHFTDGKLFTGDLGFMRDGELVVIGRIADALKVHGEWIFAEVLEEQLARSLGIAQHTCIVIPKPGKHLNGVLVIIEGPEDDRQTQKATRILRSQLGQTTPISFEFIADGQIQRTTSGKPRRHAMRPDG